MILRHAREPTSQRECVAAASWLPNFPNAPSEAQITGFFFSSRRRHTIFDCDWSSDVCSSDLTKDAEHVVQRQASVDDVLHQDHVAPRDWVVEVALDPHLAEIGRASCRERV